MQGAERLCQAQGGGGDERAAQADYLRRQPAREGNVLADFQVCDPGTAGGGAGIQRRR